jgi:hypothetical protein
MLKRLHIRSSEKNNNINLSYNETEPSLLTTTTSLELSSYARKCVCADRTIEKGWKNAISLLLFDENDFDKQHAHARTHTDWCQCRFTLYFKASIYDLFLNKY